MILVTIYTGPAGEKRGIRVSGHAEFDEYGRDIICAAVSALTLNMANSVENFTEDAFSAEEDEKSGEFRFRFTGDVSEKGKLLLDSLVLGLGNIADSYGDEYIRIALEEV